MLLKEASVLSLRLGDYYLVLEPAIPDGLDKQLSYWQKSLTPDPDAPWTRKSSGRMRALYHRDQGLIQDDGSLGERLTTLPGFYSRITNWLTEGSVAFEVKDERTPRPPIWEQGLGAIAPNLCRSQLEGVATALSLGYGRISAPTGWGKTRVMAAILSAFNPQDLRDRHTPLSAVVTPGVDVAEKNARELAELLPGRKISSIGGGKHGEAADIVVITPESLDNLDASMIGVLIYDEVHTLSESRANTVSAAHKALKFGFSASCEGRFDNADKISEGVFGPIVYTCTYPQAVAEGRVVPIEVLWLEVPRPELHANWSSSNLSRDARYRHGLWRNMPLHQKLGSLCKTLPADAQVLMIADKLEHVNYLLPELSPDTVQVHAKSDDIVGPRSRYGNITKISTKERRRIYKDIESGAIKRIVSTGIYRQGVSFPQVAVVVNLGGGGSKIAAQQLPGRASRHAEGKSTGLIVDLWFSWDRVEDGFDDDLNPKLKNGFLLSDCLSRKKVYEKLGFTQTYLGG